MTSLDNLSRQYGIQDSMVDARGKDIVTSSETKLTMLAAMGVDASNEASALNALQAVENAEWNNPVPPVIVAYADAQPIEVPIVRPQETEAVHWLLTLEDGAQRCGESTFEDLYLLDERSHLGRTLQKRLLRLPGKLPWGYHRFRLASEPMELSLIVTPGKCWLPEGAKTGKRYWGISAQLYLLRSKHNWGIGDFSDLKELIHMARERGADIVGINPVHAMFPDRAEDASPYSPSDRNLLNVLNIDVEAIPEFARSLEVQRFVSSESFRSSIAGSRDAAQVAYTEVARNKLGVLRLVFETFVRQKDIRRHDAFKTFISERASLLERACIFQALRSYFASLDPEMADCEHWPSEFKSYRSPAVARWARENRNLVQFQMWLQWVADDQLREASEAAREMAIGIYRDLAVGAHPSGAEMWCHSDALLPNVHVGAPPDIWNPAGQDWGLPPFHPKRLQHAAYRPFIELLQSNMRHCGALRIDHAMALERLYWIPAGGSAANGAFVQYQLDDLVGILALESHRNRCLVIGEDLGTVSAGFRGRMADANVLSYRVLFFERDDNGFAAADDYPYLSLSVASSHDLPTLQGWWCETDLDLKRSLNLFPTSELHSVARSQRLADRCDLLRRMGAEGLFNSCAADKSSFRNAAHKFLAKTNSMLTLVQLDDITEEVIQVNMPGTTDETPNWRRKQSLTLEELGECAELVRVAETMRITRSEVLEQHEVSRQDRNETPQDISIERAVRPLPDEKMDNALSLMEPSMYSTERRTRQPSRNLPKILSDIMRCPIRTIVPPWSWKAAAFTATFRALTFFVTNLEAGEHVALRAMWVEAVYAICAGGLAGAISQQLRRAKPLCATLLVVFVGLPGIFVMGQAGIHAIAHTPRVAGGVTASFLLTSLSSGFSWYAMRHGAMLGGEDDTTIRHDLRALPSIASTFFLSIPRAFTRAHGRSG